MGLRPFKMPDDIATLERVLPPSFQYPENPEWNIETDEIESMLDTMKGARKMWPLVRLMQLVVPPLRDIMRGFVWEEDGQAVGITNVLRQGSTDRWLIGNVSVLPEYRRRGIARKLVEAAVAYAKGRKARSIVLDVVAGNVPALTLYERLGFEHYDTSSELSFAGETPPETLPAPADCRVEAVPVGDWRPRYELALRVAPPAMQKYMPVEEGQFRQPAVMLLMMPLVARAMGRRPQPYHVTANGALVATLRTQARTRAGGLNNMGLTLDPARDDLAPYLIRHGTNALWSASPGRRIVMEVHEWQQAITAAALAAGFTKKFDYLAMGMLCDE